jgi:hypothetical protein
MESLSHLGNSLSQNTWLVEKLADKEFVLAGRGVAHRMTSGEAAGARCRNGPTLSERRARLALDSSRVKPDEAADRTT